MPNVSAGDPSPIAKEKRWWAPDIESDERWRPILALASHLRQADVGRKERDESRLRSWGMSNFGGFQTHGYKRPTITGRKYGYNVTRAVCETFVSNVTKDKPKVSVVTDGGDWEMQEKAKGLDKFLEGQFYETKFYARAPAVVRDGGGIYGTGILKWYKTGKGKKARIECMRVLPYELLVDEQEALRGAPRSLMHECWVDRLQLREMFPDHAEEIEKASAGLDTGVHGGIGFDSMADQLLVTEVWHLRSGDEAKDGRHAIVVHGVTLLDEEYELDRFPFSFYRKSEPPMGLWGVGLVEELEPLQEGLNRKCMRFEDGLRMLGAGHVLVHASSKVNFAKWDNNAGSKIEYTGQKPELMVAPEVVPEQLVQSMETDYHRAYELTGVPEAQAQGGTPTNLESGKAQEVYLDVVDKRQQVPIHAYHEFAVDCAEMILILGRDIVANDNPDFASKATQRKGGMRKIFLKDVDLREDEYVLKMWPTRLADDPAERMAQVQVMANAGWVPPDQAKRLLDFPDVEESNSLENASFEMVEDIIDEMLTEGRYMAPIPFLNLQQGIVQVQQALIKAWRARRPEKRLQLLRDWIADAQALLQAQQQPQPTAPQTQASAGGTPVQAAGPTPHAPVMVPGAAQPGQAA